MHHAHLMKVEVSMKKLVTPAILVLLAFVVRAGNQVHACLWDSETLLQERARFPSTLEIIVGKFPRHSDAYHHWRLRDRLAKRKRDPNNDELLDDIAVSYEKLGRCEQAIEVTREQLTRTPDRYESLANRGTFLVHRGELREGLVFLERAIKVNPDAHFGRERYQAILVKYILNRRDAGEIKLPLARERFSSERGIRRLPFLEFLESELGSTWNAD